MEALGAEAGGQGHAQSPALLGPWGPGASPRPGVGGKVAVPGHRTPCDGARWSRPRALCFRAAAPSLPSARASLRTPTGLPPRPSAQEPQVPSTAPGLVAPAVVGRGGPGGGPRSELGGQPRQGVAWARAWSQEGTRCGGAGVGRGAGRACGWRRGPLAGPGAGLPSLSRWCRASWEAVGFRRLGARLDGFGGPRLRRKGGAADPAPPSQAPSARWALLLWRRQSGGVSGSGRGRWPTFLSHCTRSHRDC